MQDLDDIKKFITDATVILAEVENNKELINTLSSYATNAISNISIFTQGNLQSILALFATSIVNVGGDSLLIHCEYLAKARAILIDKGGFTPEEAYGILITKKEAVEKLVHNLQDTVTKYKDEEAAKKTKKTQKEN